ncbi:vacuolar protein sorting-associated protein 54 isoform X3 [Ischnura elegans]|uniref:vacuolar protein sorting-associated protein 54 isoform X3 n=1 Tax=Ischnura elegans TaxID=197161 RepID=UPI001ED87D9A|nr:vacuolar protein sorting-associated protein 54 isoform X3 [Ischnura elegans]XP_046388600.1 vacuolar protein sorting-associated protein 54 isoform X3 [Ischnura elegans]
MAHINKISEHKGSWNKCLYCANVVIKDPQNFAKHLRDCHCTREGGSYVCNYGKNGVCYSLPLEGVCDKDYEDHILRHHISPNQNFRPKSNLDEKKSKLSNSLMAGSSESPNVVNDGAKWSIFSSTQNLPAVLNDPNRGKQKDFFTKIWGDGFVEKAEIPKHPYLPEITAAHFENYIKKISKRYRKHVRINHSVPKPSLDDELLQHFPSLRAAKSLDKIHSDTSGIPKIFLQPTLDLTNLDTFNAVYNSSKEAGSPLPVKDGPSCSNTSGKLLQERLSHYLDLVEVQIAHQVSQKSEAFFEAMSSHDALMEQLTQTISVVKTLREKIHHIDKVLVKDSLEIMKLERVRCNHLMVYKKLKLMATVHQTQPMIQLLLSTPDYVAALDLIAFTQEVLVQELAGIHSFRHLGSQLSEMERLIDKMLSTEFERYATADLNRPLSKDLDVLEGDKLVSIIFGMLRRKHFDFIETYKEEAFTTIKALMKQIMNTRIVIEAVAASDSKEVEDFNTSQEQQHHNPLPGLHLSEWTKVLQRCTSSLLLLIGRVKAVHDVMREAADVSAGKFIISSIPEDETSSNKDEVDKLCVAVAESTEVFLSNEEHAKVMVRLKELLCSVSDFAHERCGHLVSAQAKDGWLDRATSSQICQLANVVDAFVVECEKICGRTSSPLQAAFRLQASRFVQRFHNDRNTKLYLILDSERWKQADVPTEFQDLADHIVSTGKFTLHKRESDGSIGDQKPANILLIDGEKFAVVGTVLLLMKMICEYCSCADAIPSMAPNLARHAADLLKVFNSRSYKLVLGGGAQQQAGLKTITSTNLALASRALQLLLWAIPLVKKHFVTILRSQAALSAQDTAYSLPKSLNSASSPSLVSLASSSQPSSQISNGSATSTPSSHGVLKNGSVTAITSSSSSSSLATASVQSPSQQSIQRHIQSINATMDMLEIDIRSHVAGIETKLQSIMLKLLGAQLSQWDARPPVPSASFRAVSRDLTKLHEAISDVMPSQQVQELYRSINSAFKSKFKEKLLKLNIVNDGSPQHGVVTTELTFYLETLKTLKVLPIVELGDHFLEDIWSHR